MDLISLPNDILVMLPAYLHNIEDFMNASSTCRKLRDAFTDTHPNLILRLAAASAPTFVQPHPYFLIMATARRVGDWALQHEQNAHDLQHAFRGGMDDLWQLCLAKGSLTMADIRRLHLARFLDINPLSNMIDSCAGPAWASTRNFWHGGVSNPDTVDCEPVRATFQILIYGELFGSSFEAALYPSKKVPKHSTEMRLDFIRYCIPDWICPRSYWGMPKPDPVGPYAPDRGGNLEADQIALEHVLSTNTWNRAWKKVRRAIAPDFRDPSKFNLSEDYDERVTRWDTDPYWRQSLWVSAVQYTGLEGLEMLREGGVEKWRARLEKIREAVETLDEKTKPTKHTWGEYRNTNYDFPDMHQDVYVLMCGYWPQKREPVSDDDDDDDYNEEEEEEEEEEEDGQDQEGEVNGTEDPNAE